MGRVSRALDALEEFKDVVLEGAKLQARWNDVAAERLKEDRARIQDLERRMAGADMRLDGGGL